MSLDAPQFQAVNGTAFSVGIVAARYNTDLVEALLATVLARLAEAGVKRQRITVLRVPGSHEVPVAAHWLARDGKRDVIIALGVLIAGNTNHHEMVGQSVSQALQQVALASSTSVINGVVVANNRQQAEARCRGNINRGAEFAQAALEMAALKRSAGGKK